MGCLSTDHFQYIQRFIPIRLIFCTYSLFCFFWPKLKSISFSSRHLKEIKASAGIWKDFLKKDLKSTTALRNAKKNYSWILTKRRSEKCWLFIFMACHFIGSYSIASKIKYWIDFIDPKKKEYLDEKSEMGDDGALMLWFLSGY